MQVASIEMQARAYALTDIVVLHLVRQHVHLHMLKLHLRTHMLHV